MRGELSAYEQAACLASLFPDIPNKGIADAPVTCQRGRHVCMEGGASGGVGRTAVFSADRAHRYMLTRLWERGLPGALWVMLNPSMAGADADDPTIRRCISFSRGLGCGSMTVVNAFAIIATRPEELARAGTAAASLVGPENDEFIRQAVRAYDNERDFRIAAWGAFQGGEHVKERIRDVKSILRGAVWAEWRCLGVTKDGSPAHPLYVPSSREMKEYSLCS